MNTTGLIRLADSDHGSGLAVLAFVCAVLAVFSRDGDDSAFITTITRLAMMISMYPIKNATTKSASANKKRLSNKSLLSVLVFTASSSIGIIMVCISRKKATHRLYQTRHV